MKSSIIDLPRQHQQEDLFGIQVYQDALIKFIRHTDTPITIALQGEWGSGKTSLMNQLKYHLCDVDGAAYYSVWINTWQHSLMHTSSQAIIAILESIIGQIGQLSPNHKWDESKRKIGGLFKKMPTVGAKVAVGTIGMDGEVVDDLFTAGGSESTIVQLKTEIAKLVENSLAQNPQKKGFILYIDDLDRIDPPVAAKLKLRPLTEAEKESLDATEEFDNEWEKVLFRMCQKEVYLSNRVFSISGLLNKIADIVNDDEHLGEIVGSIIELSAVTNLKAFDAPMKVPAKFNRDQSNYRFNGTVYDKKVKLVNDLVACHIAAGCCRCGCSWAAAMGKQPARMPTRCRKWND